MQGIRRDARACEPASQCIGAERHRQLGLPVHGKGHKRLLTLQIIQVHRTGHGIGRHIDDPCWGTSAHGIHEQIGEEKGREMINGQIHLYPINTQLALLHMSTRVVH